MRQLAITARCHIGDTVAWPTVFSTGKRRSRADQQGV